MFFLFNTNPVHAKTANGLSKPKIMVVMLLAMQTYNVAVFYLYNLTKTSQITAFCHYKTRN